MNLALSSKKKGGKMSAAEIQLEQQKKNAIDMEQRQNARTLEAKSSQAPMIHVKVGWETTRRVCVLSSDRI